MWTHMCRAGLGADRRRAAAFPHGYLDLMPPPGLYLSVSPCLHCRLPYAFKLWRGRPGRIPVAEH